MGYVSKGATIQTKEAICLQPKEKPFFSNECGSLWTSPIKRYHNILSIMHVNVSETT